MLIIFAHFVESQAKCGDSQNCFLSLQNSLAGVTIMSLKPETQLDREEWMFSNELGWLAALAVTIVAFIPFFIYH
jgi:hypothetical protein